MAKISVISYNESPSKITAECIAGHEVLYINAPNSRRKFRRILARNGIDRTVLIGPAPEFALPELERAGVKVCTGERFMQAIYPRLMSRAAKIDRDCDSCTVYDSAADGRTLSIIKCAANFFRYVSLCTGSDSADYLAEEVLDSTGLALKLGELGGVGVVCSGKGGGQRIKIDLTASTGTTFFDENRSIITAPLAEALAGGDLGDDVLERLKLKIYSLC